MCADFNMKAQRTLPPGWRWARLSEIGRFESGGTPAKANPSFWGGKLPFVTGADITAMTITASHARAFLTEAGLASGKTAVCPPGAVLFVTRTRVGRVGIASETMGASQDLSPYICGREAIPEYVCRYLSGISECLLANCRGSTIQGLTREFIQSLEIPLPPLAEQKRIAAVLTEQMGLVERARAAVEAQLEAARSLPAAYLRAVFNSPEAKSWPRRRLGELASGEDSFADGPFGSNLKTEHYAAEGARVVRLQNIGRGVFLDEDKAFVPMDHYENLLRHGVRPGDVVVAALGDGARPAGRACAIPESFGPGLVKADCFRVRLPLDTVLPSFLVAYLNSPPQLAWVAGTMRGATRPRVTLRMLQDVQLPMAPITAQEQTVKLLAGRATCTDSTIAHLEAEQATVQALPAALLGRAFRGEL